MSIINKIKNCINKKERLEIESWKKSHAQIRKEYEDCYSIIINNRIAIHKTVDELVAMGTLSKEDRTTFYEVLDKNGYVKNYHEYWLKHHEQGNGSR